MAGQRASSQHVHLLLGSNKPLMTCALPAVFELVPHDAIILPFMESLKKYHGDSAAASSSMLYRSQNLTPGTEGI